MASGALDIANDALRRIHTKEEYSLDAGTERAGQLRRELDLAVDYVARKSGWTELSVSVCLDRASVPEGAECSLPPPPLEYPFFLPPDMIRAERVHESGVDPRCAPDVRWKLSQIDTNAGRKKVLLSDRESVVLQYVARPTDFDMLPPEIKELIRLRLAYNLAPFINADKSLRAEIGAEFERELMDAKHISSGQNADWMEQPDSSLVEAREHGGYWGAGTRYYGKIFRY